MAIRIVAKLFAFKVQYCATIHDQYLLVLKYQQKLAGHRQFQSITRGGLQCSSFNEKPIHLYIYTFHLKAERSSYGVTPN